MATTFLGPIISTSNLDEWRRLLPAVFGMEIAAEQTLTADEVASLWQVSGQRADSLVFETAGTPYGIRVIQLSPGGGAPIRNPDSGYDCNALKVIDFFTADFAAARDRLEAAGFRLKDEVAEYDTEGGKVVEAHLWGPDSVVCALVGGSAAFVDSYVTVTDRLVSEVHSVSCPVDDQPAVVEFYRRVLGLEEVHRYEITDTSFQHLVGAKDPLHIRAINVGTKKTEPYFGIIHYGLPEGSYRSLQPQARLPNRGLVGATLSTEDIGDVVARARAAGAPIIAPMTRVNLAPYGEVDSFTLSAPHGVMHQVLQIVQPAARD